MHDVAQQAPVATIIRIPCSIGTTLLWIAWWWCRLRMIASRERQSVCYWRPQSSSTHNKTAFDVCWNHNHDRAIRGLGGKRA